MNPTERFTSRVENYRRYRPGYPADVVGLIRQTARLSPGNRIADVGSGTGIFTQRLLEAGYEVFAVEPNQGMREAAEHDLAAWTGFHSVAASAEQTGLPDHHVHAITSAQAFHWFDRAAVRLEFGRILVPGQWIFLIWNERKRIGSPFQEEYQALLATLGQEYEGVRRRAEESEDDLRSFFAPGSFGTACFDNPQRLTWEGLKGRFLSSSYVPKAEDPRQAGLLAGLESIFRRHQREGEVEFDQETRVYYGQV
jgi:SAM-dependent methyltransferase